MKHIIVGTDRQDSNSAILAEFVKGLYIANDDPAEVIHLGEIDYDKINCSHYGNEEKPKKVSEAIKKIDSSEGLIIVCPEYNGSYPGALKYFIDQWSYPRSFEYRPVCFIGLGGRWGGLRPVEHLQGVFGYRNAFMYPERVFVSNVWSVLKEGSVTDPLVLELLEKQTQGFKKFVHALKSQGLDANSQDL